MTDHDDFTRTAAVFAENVRREMRVRFVDRLQSDQYGLVV